MANLPESSTFDAGVYQLELTDPVIGGPSGVSNTPLKNLANRTRYLKDQIDTLSSGKAPLASPAFTGNPTAPTAAQFDDDTSIASTEFVQRALGNFRGVNGTFSSSTTLTAAHIGLMLHVSGSPTLALPAANSVPAGAAIAFSKIDSSYFTIARSSTDNVLIGTQARTNAIVYGGETITLVSNGSNAWYAISGSALAQYTGNFAASASGQGYQKMPSGIILQWGSATMYSATQANSFPIAFPNALLQISIGHWNNGAAQNSPVSLRSSGTNTSQFTAYCWNFEPGATGISYIAVGY